MKLCAVFESLGHLSFKEAAKASADLGLAALEIGIGNWSAASHADLQSLLQSKEKRREFLSVFEQNGLSLAALNCSGNQLHPVDGERQSPLAAIDALGDAIHHVHAKDIRILQVMNEGGS